MEEQRASLANILLQHPDLDIDAAVTELSDRVNRAVQQVDPAASVRVVLHTNWVSITPTVPACDEATKHAIVAAIYDAKEAWYRHLLTAESIDRV